MTHPFNPAPWGAAPDPSNCAHEWPPIESPDAACHRCGLPYVEWSDPADAARQRLDQLCAAYDEAEAAAKAAADRFDVIKAGIKAEAQRLYPGRDKLTIEADGLSKPLQLRHQTSLGIDVPAMRAAAKTDPALALAISRFPKPSESWVLSRVRGNS